MYLFSLSRSDDRGKDNLLYNALLDTLKTHGIGFRADQVGGKNAMGDKVVNTIFKALWFIDPHLDKLHNRSITIPAPFDILKGYNCPKDNKKKIPMVSFNNINIEMKNDVKVKCIGFFLI